MTSTPYVYEKTLSEGSQIQFQEGDIVGVYTPPVPRLSFKHQRHGGETSYYRAGISDQQSTMNTNDIGVTSGDDVPLLTIETTPPGCISGLIDRDALLIKARTLAGDTTDISYREATQRIIPDAVFPCDGHVTNITLAALSHTSGSYPEVQIWRNTGEDSWFKVHSVSSQAAVVRTNSLNIHEYLLPESLALPVLEGDIVGVYQPYTASSQLQVYLTGSSRASYYHSAQLHAADSFPVGGLLVFTENRVPLITMEISECRVLCVLD